MRKSAWNFKIKIIWQSEIYLCQSRRSGIPGN